MIETLISSEGFEIYLKSAKYYLNFAGGITTDLFSVADAVAAKHEIFIGYKIGSENGGDPILNPVKVRDGGTVPISLREKDQLIVLAESPEVR